MDSSVTMETDQDTSQTAMATENTTENTLPTMLVHSNIILINATQCLQ